MHIKKGNVVKIIAGKNRGSEGKVLRVLSNGKISVDGMNKYKKHMRPKKEGEKGKPIEVNRPFHSSNAMVICSGCSKPTRLGSKIEGDKKTKICKKCGAEA